MALTHTPRKPRGVWGVFIPTMQGRETMECIMYVVLPAMFFAGVGLTETTDARTPLWFVGYAGVATALALFLAQVVLCNI